MKKRLYQIICLIISCLLTGYLFVHISYMYRGYTRLMGFYDLDRNTIDVVFIGTSVTFSSFMPMDAWGEYGYTAYNYCTNVQFEDSMRYSLKEVCKMQSPQVIVVDVAPFIYQHCLSNEDWTDDQKNQYIKYNLDSRRYSLGRTAIALKSNKAIDGNVSTLFQYLFDISHYHNRMPILDQWDNAVDDISRGYGYLSKNGGVVIDMKKMVQDDGAELPLEEPHATYFSDLLTEVNFLDTEVIFYCAPIFWYNKNHYAYKNYMKRIVEEEGYSFWDFSLNVEEFELNPQEDFWSFDHFDSLGAEKVTKQIAKQLDDVYDLPDHREDAAYSSWWQDYDLWLEQKEAYQERDRETE